MRLVLIGDIPQANGVSEEVCPLNDVSIVKKKLIDDEKEKRLGR